MLASVMSTILLLAVAQAGAAEAAGPDMVQATKLVCRYEPTSPRVSAPVCRGDNRLGPAECRCQTPDRMFKEPACLTNGQPAMFPAGKRLSSYDTSRLVSCIEWRRRHDKKD